MTPVGMRGDKTGRGEGGSEVGGEMDVVVMMAAVSGFTESLRRQASLQ